MSAQPKVVVKIECEEDMLALQVSIGPFSATLAKFLASPKK